MTPAELRQDAELRRKPAEAATPGPWSTDASNDGRCIRGAVFAALLPPKDAP